MTIDDRVEPPDQPPTARIEAVPMWAVEMAKAQQAGFKEVRNDLETVKAEGQRTNLRLTRQEVRMDDVETRLANNSERASRSSDGVRALSSADLEQQAKLAGVIVETAELKKAIVETRAIVADQSDFMGMGKKGLTWLGSKEGRTAMAQAGAALVVLYEALRHGGILK